MSNIYDTHFPESVRENVPEQWQPVVLAWLKSNCGSFIPSVYLDHDFIEWVAGSEAMTLNQLNPSYAFFRMLPHTLIRSFGPGDAVSISFDTASETVLFLGEGQWDQGEEEQEPGELAGQTNPEPFRPRFFIGIWPGLEDFDL